MKVKSIKLLDDGMSEADAEKLWNDIEGFASYGFNASHAVAYTLLSYICMALKVYYPAEYFSGALTVEKVEKRPAILEDMKRYGISLVMPDINHSTDCFTPVDDKTITCPFTSIKGISSVATKAIIKERAKGPFKSMQDLRDRVPARSCNVGVIDKLNRVGAFANIEENQPPANDSSRVKDQVELMEGLIDNHVFIDRPIVFDEDKEKALVKVVQGYRANTFGGDEELSCPCPYVGASPKFVIVVDSPSRDEESSDVMGTGLASASLKEALSKAGISLADTYYTSFFKTVKSKKPYSSAHHAAASEIMQEEMKVVNPPLIVAMGQESAKYFVPDMPGKFAENEARVFYDAENDWNVLIGMNPNRVIYDESKQENIDNIIAKAASIVGVS